MASYGQQMSSRPGGRHAPHGGYQSPMPVAPGVVAPAGTFQPGTKIQVGSHRVVIQKYLSEGGFAHVYLVKLPKPVDGTDQAVLKRVAVPDKEALRGMRTEVETMKRLKGHRMIVTYIDSHASEMKGGGYEVFLLMEFCGGGGLIDFMNTRLQHRLTEPEILNIFCDIAEGVACMHYLKPALLHRDLKIENVLITNRGSSKRFKLCDFGSSAPPRPAPTSVVECRLMDEDVQKHTTLQYRSPEMVDVYRKQPLNEKSDIWALGVFLYKLCYYTTPFEDQGQLAILNASYRFPSQPAFSDRLKKLIASMLRENLEQRPNIYQVVKEACAMQGRDLPIHDIYSGKAKPDPRPVEKASAKEQKPASSGVGAVWSPPVEEKQKIPEVTPMRRGRPTASPAPGLASQQSRPHSKPSGGDPFAALDSKPKSGEPDEFSSRFPSLDQFSLLHDQGSGFDFDSTSAPAPPPKKADTTQKVTEHLADEVFAASRSPPMSGAAERPSSVAPAVTSRVVSQQFEKLSKNSSGPAKQDVSRAQSIISSNPDLQAISTQTTPRYVSTGTSTSDLPSLAAQASLKPSYRASAIQTSESPRSTSMSRQSSNGPLPSQSQTSLPSINARVSSIQSNHARAPLSSRASIEVSQPPEDLMDFPSRSNTLDVERPVERARPQSTNFETTTTMDFLREREVSRPSSRISTRHSPQVPSPNLIPTDDEPQAPPQPEADNLEFLRTMESGDANKDKSAKRSSLGSLSGGKGMLASKFGDAFKRFEGGQQSSGRTPSPLKEHDRQDLTPITGSVATDGRSDDGHIQDDSDHMTPEMRRELERRQLEEEEQRVEAAQAAYRNRVATGGASAGPKNTMAPSRANTIQNRVQNLLDEQKVSHVKKTASGYGKYSDEASAASKQDKPLPEPPRKPITTSKPPVKPPHPGVNPTVGTASAPPTLPPNKPKPAAPKKPVHLNSLPTGQRSPAKASQPQTTEQLIAVDLPGQPVLDMSAHEKDSYLEEFSQRFPSLSAMEGGGASSGR